MTETYPKDIALLGVPIEVGASQKGALMGPAALRTAGIVQLLESLDFTVADHGDIAPRDLVFTDEAPPPSAKHYREIKAWIGETSKRAYAMAQSGAIPVFLGGDHSLSMGTVNGVARRIEIDTRARLVDVIRDTLHLTGTHLGCGTGSCGACTVVLDGNTVKSCCTLAVDVDGASISTIEGLGDDGRLHPVQEAFAECHGLQCGFCTPGFLVSTHDLLARSPSPSDPEIREALAGNLCRCTGYEKILDAVRAAASAGAQA